MFNKYDYLEITREAEKRGKSIEEIFAEEEYKYEWFSLSDEIVEFLNSYINIAFIMNALLMFLNALENESISRLEEIKTALPQEFCEFKKDVLIKKGGRRKKYGGRVNSFEWKMIKKWAEYFGCYKKKDTLSGLCVAMYIYAKEEWRK